MISAERWLTELWYEPGRKPPAALRGLSWLYDLGRRRRERLGRKKAEALGVPVVVVGNISVGGTGKTPFVIWLCEWLRSRGLAPGILSSGYGGRLAGTPTLVTAHQGSELIGDEAALLAARAIAPIAIGKERVAAAELLLRERNCDVLVCDDGLQHYRLHRDIEIVLIDAERRFGNGWLLPAGPLREPVDRLDNVDLVVNHGDLTAKHHMRLHGDRVIGLFDERELQPARVHAVAGIGNPQRFFSQLSGAGFDVIPHPFPDHYAFRQSDIEFGDSLPVVMTEKDAVKCRSFPIRKNLWFLPVNAVVSDDVASTLEALTEGWGS